MDRRKGTPGIETRHRKRCQKPRDDGKCCGASFQAQVFDQHTGKPIKRSFPTRTAARLWRDDARKALRDGDRGALAARRDGKTVHEALTALVAAMKTGEALDRSGRRYKPSTIRTYKGHADRVLTPKLGHLRLHEVRRSDVQRVVDQLAAAGMTGSTTRNVIDPLRVVYRRALEDEEVTSNPTDHIRHPARNTKLQRVANPERVTALLDALPDPERAVWAMAFYGGERVGELRALRVCDVDFDQRVIRVRAGWDDVEGDQDPKTAAGVRTIPLVGRLRAELARHILATRRTGTDLLFGRTATDAFVRSTLRSRALRAWGWKTIPNPKPNGPKTVLAKAREDALDPLTPREARHCCASYLAAAGLTPKEVQTAMGHASITTTMNIYAQAVPGWEERAAAKLDAYFGDNEDPIPVANVPVPRDSRATVDTQLRAVPSGSPAVRSRATP